MSNSGAQSPISQVNDSNKLRTKSITKKVSTKKKFSSEDFEFGKELGKGAFSKVLLATYKKTGDVYAIKIISQKLLVENNQVKTVKMEKQVLSMMKHPHIIGLFCTYIDSESLYFVLELAPGGDLFRYVSRYGKIKSKAIVYYMAQLVDALEYMHGLGILHRDLKPENLIFDKNMQLKVTDFGTAKLLDSNSEEELQKRVKGTFCGTAQYVSPEVIAGEEQSMASDLWGLGCIIYQLYTSKYPFIGLSDYLIFQKIKERDLEFPSFIPDDAKDLIDKLLQVDPSKRIGAGPDGYKELKAHPFFNKIDWKNLINNNPPELVDEDLKEQIDRKIKQEEEKKNLPPKVEDDDDDEEMLLMKKQKEEAAQKKQNPQKEKKNATNPNAESQVAKLKDLELTKEWENFLMKGEFIVYAAPMIKRSRLSSKRRMLLLTCFPRFIYVDPDKWEMKGVIQFTDDIQIIPSTKDMKKFIIKTPGRNYDIEDLNADVDKWMDYFEKLKDAMSVDEKNGIEWI
eukprot:gene4609-7991_t